MRISHKHKFIFLAVPKTGSTTIRRCLDSYSDIHSINDPEGPLHWHARPPELKEYFEEQHWNWDEYFKFTFVRNPWSRAVSMYVFRGRKTINEISIAFPGLGQWIVDCSPENFRKYLKHKPYTTGRQMIYVNGCDFVGKIENLQQDFNTVCDKVGIPQQQVPHKNKTKHKHYTEFYDNETRELVAEKYAEEIEYFGYKFGE
tara:strand:+ start:205 stop:807 length:603 start_codon:yes stop_codon:yes gene_type:complete